MWSTQENDESLVKLVQDLHTVPGDRQIVKGEKATRCASIKCFMCKINTCVMCEVCDKQLHNNAFHTRLVLPQESWQSKCGHFNPSNKMVGTGFSHC